MSRNIAILASNSFAGSAFAASALAKGCAVLGLSRSPEADDIFLPYKHIPESKNFIFRQLDINKDFEEICSALAAFKPEFIVDFAGQGMVAESWRAPEQWYQTNILSKVRLHQFLLEQSWLKRYVRASTPEVYGSCDHPVDEQQPLAPSTPYAVSHAAIDMSLMAFFRHYGFPVVLGRFANFYGEHQQLYRLIPKLVLSVRAGTRFPLHGGGQSRRAFVHVDEVADAIWRMLELSEPGTTYHFSPDRYRLIAEVVQEICSLLD